MKKVFFFLPLLCVVNFLSAQWLPSPVNGNDIYNTNAGNVGIGTNAPQAKLDVNGMFYLNKPALLADQANSLGIPAGSYLVIAPSNLSSTNNSYISLSFPDNNSFRIASDYDGHLGTGIFRDIQFGRHSEVAPYMTIKDGGNVGIGTTSPGSFKLAVEGALGARSVKVTLTNPWPDFVFQKKYRLLTLDSLERYVAQNEHLPGIPSAQEVQKTGNVDLGEMNVRLLEKVEELTLYMIQLKKENEEIKKELKRILKK